MGILFLTSIIFGTLFNLSFAETTHSSDTKSSTEHIVYSRRCGIWENCNSNGQIVERPRDIYSLSDIFDIDIQETTKSSDLVTDNFDIEAFLRGNVPKGPYYSQQQNNPKRVRKLKHPVFPTHNSRRCGIWENCISDGLYGQNPDIIELTVSTESTMSTAPPVSTESTRSNGPYWETFNPDTSVLPSDAIIGGFENETLYIVRAAHEKSLTPGKYVPSQHKGYIPWGYKSHEKVELEILRGNNYKWVQSTKDIPKNAVLGGNSEHYHDLLYVCRARHLGYTIPGKIDPHYKKCYIPYHGKEVEKMGIGDYEVLVVSE